MKLLMIEDDIYLCDSLKFQLEKQGFSVDACHDGEDGLALIMEQTHDLILLDRMLPGMDGLKVLSKARERGISTPIILVTALSALPDRVSGLNTGADDYIGKPFAFEELLARIHCLLRRPTSYQENLTFSFGDITYDSTQKILTCQDSSCSLSRREGDLLELFLKNPSQTIPRSTILSRVWGVYAEIEEGNLDNYIYFLRRRLKSVGSTLTLKTIRGVGYRLEELHA